MISQQRDTAAIVGNALRTAFEYLLYGVIFTAIIAFWIIT